LAQVLFGAAEAAVAGDNLDVTTPEKPTETQPVTGDLDTKKEESERVVLGSVSGLTGSGMTIVQPLVFGGIVVGVIVAYIKMRSRSMQSHSRFPV